MMKRTELLGTVSIARVGGSNKVAIRIKDGRSGTTFVTVEVELTAFAEGLFGLAERPSTLIVENLGHVGKKREDVPRILKLSKAKLKEAKLNPHDRGALEQYLIKNAQKPGWELNPYLGLQSSIEHHAEGVLINFSYTRYA
jgi:hypothetical protein